jgi:hypothetical protein
VSANATLGGSEHGGVTVTITSSAPGLVLVSPDGSTAGSASISVTVPNGQTFRTFYVQGLENVSGAALVTVSAPGFTDGQFAVTVVPSGVEIVGLDASRSAGGLNDTNWYVQVGIPNASNASLSTLQNVRAGSPGFVVTISNGNAAVAQLSSDEPAATGQTVTKPIQPGSYYTQALAVGTSYGLAFDPLAAGSTTVTVSGPPGVLTMMTSGVRTVIVTP